MFLKRSDTKEIMDDFSIKDERIDKALTELKLINKYLGGKSTSKEGIKKIIKGHNEKDIKILDAGAGASDVLLSFQANHPAIRIFSFDKNIRACKYLKQNSSSINVVCADIFNLPFKKNFFDIVHASLFLHHFNEAQLLKILSLFNSISKRGIIINDLRRSFFAYAGIKLLTGLFSGSRMIKNDAPVSVKRSFIKSELTKIFNSLKFHNFEIKRRWAFRWLVVIYLYDL